MENESYLIIRIFSEDKLVAKTELYVGDRTEEEIRQMRRENIDCFMKIFVNVEKIITFVTKESFP